MALDARAFKAGLADVSRTRPSISCTASTLYGEPELAAWPLQPVRLPHRTLPRRPGYVT